MKQNLSIFSNYILLDKKIITIVCALESVQLSVILKYWRAISIVAI